MDDLSSRRRSRYRGPMTRAAAAVVLFTIAVAVQTWALLQWFDVGLWALLLAVVGGLICGGLVRAKSGLSRSSDSDRK